jgi:DNA-binding LytR/AlgR family response regulator
MNVLIIEDEPQAAQRLEKLVLAIEPSVTVLDRIDSVKRSVEWLLTNKHPDLIFMDIHLADGISFSIFEQCEVKVPVIFTTAYDAYALKAFKVNSIDYILKPVDKDELESAFKKLRNNKAEVNTNALLDNISQAMSMLTKKFKTRFVIKIGEHLKTVEIEQVLYFYSQEKTTFCHIGEGRNLVLDYTLEQLEEMVDPGLFFRINRKYMVTAPSILDIISHTNSRLKLILKGCNDNDIIVARERVQQFKDWLDR